MKKPFLVLAVFLATVIALAVMAATWLPARALVVAYSLPAYAWLQATAGGFTTPP